MCLKKQMMGSSEMQTKIKTPRSPYRRHLREPLKPRLSRNIVASARVNLNKYWSKFEELSKVIDTELPRRKTATVLLNNSFYDNEINENLVNELIELGNSNIKN